MSDFLLKGLNLGPLPEHGREGEHWGRHHLAYLAWCADRCPLSLKELAVACGYRKLQKFDRRRRRWNEGKGRIPLRYLKAIGVDLALLQDCVALDCRQHEAALQKPRFPRFFVARAAAAIYTRLQLPKGTTEEEAIERMREHAMATGRSCIINHPGLPLVFVSRDGRVISESLAPELQVTGGAISFGDRGDGVGVMRIRRGGQSA